MYAAKHRKDEAYIPRQSNARAVVNAVTHETEAAPVASPARNMHAMLDSQFNIGAEGPISIAPFQPVVSLAIIVGFCGTFWVAIAAILLPML